MIRLLSVLALLLLAAQLQPASSEAAAPAASAPPAANGAAVAGQPAAVEQAITPQQALLAARDFLDLAQKQFAQMREKTALMDKLLVEGIISRAEDQATRDELEHARRTLQEAQRHLKTALELVKQPVPAMAPPPPAPPMPTPKSALGRQVAERALEFQGVRYRWGGLSSRGLDCSGLVWQVLRTFGMLPPRTAARQATLGEVVHSPDLQPGDLLFFHTTRPGISHVGVYLGDGKFVHASSRWGRVQISELKGYYARRLVAARRVRRLLTPE